MITIHNPTNQMCDVLINSLSWIDNEFEDELIIDLKNYRNKLILHKNNRNINDSFPIDPRSLLFPKCGTC